MGRAPCCDKASVKRGPWSPEEDNTLRSFIQSHGTGGNWISLPGKAGLKRCGKSCRLRWLNYLRPDIKHGGFTEEEDNIIITLYNNIGSRWSVIASHLPQRTDNDVKNYWNTKLKKKLSAAERVLVLNKPVVPKVEDYYNYGSAAAPPLPQCRSKPLISNPAVVLDHDQFPHLDLMEVSELINTSTYSSNIASSMTQEVSSLSAASSSLALDNNGGRGLLLRDDDGDDQLFIDFGSPYELLSGFCFQQQPPHGLIMDQF